MRVYRVEDDDGFGAYSNGAPGVEGHFERLADRINDDELWAHWPVPDDDSALVAAGYWSFEDKYGHSGIRFCFISIQQFKAWFYKGEMRTAMKNDGCHLSVYEVDVKYVCAGDSQAIFVAGNETLIEKIDLESV